MLPKAPYQIGPGITRLEIKGVDPDSKRNQTESRAETPDFSYVSAFFPKIL